MPKNVHTTAKRRSKYIINLKVLILYTSIVLMAFSTMAWNWRWVSGSWRLQVSGRIAEQPHPLLHTLCLCCWLLVPKSSTVHLSLLILSSRTLLQFAKFLWQSFPAYLPFFPDSCPLQFNKHQVDYENTKQRWFLGRPQSINVLPFLEWAHWASWIVFWPLLSFYHSCVINNIFGMFVKVICQKLYWIPVHVFLLPYDNFLSV